MSTLHVFSCGALSATCVFVGLFFVKYYRASRDRLFLFLTVTFWVLATNWVVLALIGEDQNDPAFYVPRLLAFLILIAGIVDKNRRTNHHD